MAGRALARFGPATRAWFTDAFAAPTVAQEEGWRAIAGGRHALVVAPTGSGKTLAAFLWALDRLATRVRDPDASEGVRVVYVSPLKALAVDVERNLRAPLAGIRAAAERAGAAPPSITIGLRTGDTPAGERRRLGVKPPDILITTPESLYLYLTSAARETLRTVETVIVDEIHALVGTKRGAHLALGLERFDRLLARPAQRIGLSATARPTAEVARFLAGGRDVAVVEAPADKRLEVAIEVPPDVAPPPDEGVPSGPASGRAPAPSIWPRVEARVLELIRAHRSTIVFANSRRLAERLCARLNELAGDEIARAHHGSVAREQREAIEEALKTGRLPAVVATSSLELGIDMGAVDLVVQIEAPVSVASGLQRIGRAGHAVGAVSRGVVFPKYRGDLLESAVVVERMRAGALESLAIPRNPLDVLAQQIVAMVAVDDWTVDELETLVRRAAPFAELPRAALESVLDMLAGRLPSEFAGVRPRIVWDRTLGRLTARRGARAIAVTSGGTIPDRGLYGVFLVGEKRSRVGELDEEMVYESRIGDVFLLGASSWRIEDITADRVLVSPAPGLPGKMPFWHGDAPGRPVELGRALGAFIRETSALDDPGRRARLSAAGLDARAQADLLGYLDEQRAATGVLPDDRTLVVERFRDEVGDWRLCVLSPFGARVHAPWAQAIAARLRPRLGADAQVIYTDDGLVVRVPDGEEPALADVVLLDPEEVSDLVVAEVGHSALFASRFRECATRALLLPRRRPGSRTPLWLQRQKAADLQQAAQRHPAFAMVLETHRECLQDVFDLPALVALLRAIRDRTIRVVEVETPVPSPFAASLQHAYVSAFMYEGDAPLAERRAQALALDRGLLAELMGDAELRDLLDPDVLVELELELQRLTGERRARDPDEVHDLLRTLGDLDADEIAARTSAPAAVPAWLATLADTRRALRVRVGGVERWIAGEDAARYRDAAGVVLPAGLPRAFTEPVIDPVGDLLARWARTHGPFVTAGPARRLGLGTAVVERALEALAASGRLARGEFRPGGRETEWIDVDVLRRLRRRSLAALRREVEPVGPDALARFALGWHDAGTGGPRLAGVEQLWRAVEQLQGVPLPASELERRILPARVPGYAPAMLDQLGASGELAWAGAGALGTNDGWIVLALAEAAPLLLPEPAPDEPSPLASRAIDALAGGGALFFRQLSAALGGPEDAELLLALWELVWAGRVTNDTIGPLRALLRHRPIRADGSTRWRSRRAVHPSPPAAVGRWSVTPVREPEATRRRHAAAEQALRRHGVVTRGAIAADRIAGGFGAVYPVLAASEEAGRCRRGYFVEGLGGAQFALPGAVDRLRAVAAEPCAHVAVVLAATDPANPYGAALSWPERADDGGHRAGRKAGATVVLVDGILALYVERGGRTVLSYVDDPGVLRAAAAALADAVRSGVVRRLSLERANGDLLLGGPLAEALRDAGFAETWRGGVSVRA